MHPIFYKPTESEGNLSRVIAEKCDYSVVKHIFFMAENKPIPKRDILCSVQSQFYKAYELADAIIETKFFLNNEGFILMEILTSNESTELNAFMKKHIDSSEGFQREIDNAMQISGDKTWRNECQSLKTEIYNQTRNRDRL